MASRKVMKASQIATSSGVVLLCSFWCQSCVPQQGQHTSAGNQLLLRCKLSCAQD